MFRLTTLVAALMLMACLDFPRVYLLRSEPVTPLDATILATSSPPDLFLTVSQSSSGKSQDKARTESQLAIIRYVDEEYAHVVQPLPADKNGFRYTVGQPIPPKQLHTALMRGSAANPGDQVQITNIEFREKEIIVSINGGTKKHFNLAQHLQIDMTGVPVTTVTPVGAPPPSTRIGAELVLAFGKRVPILTPDDLKHDLSPFLNFGGEHSAAVNWIDTLPPEFRRAIKNRTAIVGMNHDMVLAALGRPDQKVREYDDAGHETEDWIYGSPPEKTVLVTFLGDKVIRVKSYN
jgi:hypothetical protein